jgi:hypothetical protein
MPGRNDDEAVCRPRKAMTKCLTAYSLVIVVASSACASAQSLADVARREEARRHAVGTPGKVYTNDSLHPEPSPPAPPAAAPASSTGAAADTGAQAVTGATKDGKDAAAPADSKKDEAYWKRRLQNERDGLERAKTFAEALQSRINALTADFINRDDPAQRSQIGVDRQKALTELDRVTREIQQHTKAIADIQEEGRKAGVPAGWLR